ncbi:MAG: LPS assembly lipoprotein LptE [Bdellovibrionota bacterium]
MLISLFAVTACGYHVGDFRTPTQELRVFVPVFENRSVRPLDLNDLTSEFRENLESIRGVSSVNSRDDADVLLLGQIIQYDRSWGTTAFKGTRQTEAAGGLREDALSASTARITLGMRIEKRTRLGELLSSSNYVETDLYEMSDRLELSQGSAAIPQIHASREALLIKKLVARIFQRARAQIVDDF